MLILEIVVGPNTTPQNRLVRIAPAYKHIVRPCPIRCGTLNTPPHDQHYWAWFVDINGGWLDSGNQIAGDPMDLGEALIPS